MRQEKADQVLETLIEFGVNHIDTAASYGDSELRIGPWMARHRDRFFLASKTGDRTAEGARASIASSLERLQAEHLDLIQLHNLVDEEGWRTAMGPGGALEALLEAPAPADPLTFVATAAQTKRFIDYAINTYKVDTSRIYMGGHSQGSGNTWDYVVNYPQQLAAVFPISGGYGSSVGCMLGSTPSWAFIGRKDATVPYMDQVNTVNSINACNPTERSRITVLADIGHNDVETPVLALAGLGQGMSEYDLYDQSIYTWLLQHSRP
jgi:hypothetical protein